LGGDRQCLGLSRLRRAGIWVGPGVRHRVQLGRGQHAGRRPCPRRRAICTGRFRLQRRSLSRRRSRKRGMVTVSGNASWINTGSLWIGVSGAGGVSGFAGSAVASGVTVLGVADGASGLAVVNAVGSSWAVTDNLAVGAAGAGNLFVNDDGQTSVAGNVLTGIAETGFGTIDVERGGVLNIAGNLVAGIDGSTIVRVEDGGTMMSAGAVASAGKNGLANIFVTGAGSGWANSGTLELGASGFAQLTISGGAGVTNNAAVLGAEGSGLVTVDNASWINAGDVTIGQF